MIRFRDVLTNKNFLFLWLGQLISNFGDRLTQMAFVALVYQRSPGSAMALAKLISFTLIPVFLIGPIAGVWVDRLNRRHVMIVSDVLRGVLILSVPFFIMANQILPIYLVIFLAFTISRFFIPSKMALIPDLVSKDKLLVANTLQDTTHMIGNVVGLVVAGVIVNIKRIGAIGGFYIDAASFFVSAVFIAMIIQNEIRRDINEELKITKEAFENSLRRSFIRELKEGISYITQYSSMRFIVSVFFILMAGLGAVSCVIIVFIQKAFGSATRDLGFLGMSLAAGLFLGTVIYGRFGQRVQKKRAIYASFALSGVVVMSFTYSVGSNHDILAASFLAAILGMSISPIMISTTTITHETIPHEARGRIFSSLEIVIHLAFLLFMFIAAWLAKYINEFWILTLTGAVFLVSGIFGLALSYAASRKRSSNPSLF